MADTAVSIGCRKTIEVASRLSAWLERSDALASEVKPVIDTALQRATLDLRRVMRSIEFPPCVGIVGGPDRSKLQLAASSLFREGITSIKDFSDLRNQQIGFGAMLEQVASDDLGTALRFRRSSARTTVKEGHRFPVQVDLLSTLDVVKIVVTAYHAHYPTATHDAGRQDEIQRIIDRADRELSNAAVSGFSPEDIANLRQHLWTEFPRVDSLRTLSTSGYWDWLTKHIAHLSVQGRCEILSYLWQFEPNFTALFQRLTEALGDLGYATSVRIPIESILVTDPETGGVAPHAASIIRQTTVSGLLNDEPAAADLSVSLGQGIIRHIDRATLAALAHTLTLRVSQAAPFPLESTDLKIFPSPEPPTDLSLHLAADGPDDAARAGRVEQLYARNKSIYSFARACTQNELSAILLLADREAVADDTHMPAISDWIELSEGADPRARERMENCLAIVIKTPDAIPDTIDARDGSGGPPDTAEFLADLLGENNRWAEEWTPGRAFSQIHFVPDFTTATTTTQARQVDLAAVANDGAFPAHVPAAAPPTKAASVLLDIAANNSQVIRAGQIRRQLATIQRAMQARMFRYHRSNNPAQFTDWRRQIANVATKRLEATAEQHKLGIMVSALTLAEGEIQMLLAGLKGDALGYQEIDRHAIDVGHAALPDPEVCAEAVIASWLKLMHEAASSRQLCSQLDFAQAVFQHIIDEIVIGAHRGDLVGTVTAKFERALDATSPHGNLARSYAVIGSRAIGNFLGNLTVARSPIAAPSRQLSGAYGATPQPERMAAATQADDARSSQLERWPSFFRQMVDDNIIAAEGLTAHSEADHELGEYLSMLTSNPLEVEL